MFELNKLRNGNIISFRKIDIFIGALDENELPNDLIASRAYYHDVLTWCVQEKQAIPIWKNIFGVAKNPMLFVGLSMVLNILFTATTYFFQQFDDIKWDSVRLSLAWICCCSGFVCGYKPDGISTRMFYSFNLLGSMIFTICYYARFQHISTKYFYNDQIESISAIVNNSFELMGDEFALKHLMNQNEVK